MDETTIKSYFLGALSADAAEQFEEQAAGDSEIAEQIQIVESELVDDYLRGVLGASERRSFEDLYLITEARRKKLKLAGNLWNVVNLRETPQILTVPLSWRQIIFGNPQKLAFAALIIAAAVGIGLFLLYRKDRTEIVRSEQNGTGNTLPGVSEENRNSLKNAENTIKEKKNETAGSSANLNNSNRAAAPINNSNKKVPPPPKNETEPAPKISVPPPTLASFTLFPGILRGEGGQFVKISPNFPKVNLRLKLPKDAVQYQNYRAVLQTADGETTATVENLKSFNLTLPAEKLEARTYLIRLEGKNAETPAESIADYTFRVRR